MTPETVLEYLKVIGEYLSPAYLAVRQYVIILAVKGIIIRLIAFAAICGPITWFALWLYRGRKQKPTAFIDKDGDDWYRPVLSVAILLDTLLTLMFIDTIANYIITLIAPDIPTVIWLIQQVKQP